MSYLRDRGYDYGLEEVWKGLPNHEMPLAETKRTSLTSDPGVAECKYCHAGNLMWAKLDVGWRMLSRETGIVHNCPDYPTHQPKRRR